MRVLFIIACVIIGSYIVNGNNRLIHHNLKTAQLSDTTASKRLMNKVVRPFRGKGQNIVKVLLANDSVETAKKLKALRDSTKH